MYKYQFRQFDLHEKAYGTIKNVIKRFENPYFMIFPYGNCGKIVRKILEEEFGITPKFIVDSNVDKHTGEEIVTFDQIDVDAFIKGGGIVLLSSNSEFYYVELRNIVGQKFPIGNVVDVYSPSMYFNEEVFFEDSVFDKSDGAYSRAALLESCSKEIYANGVKGDLAECGVYQGDFTVLMNTLFPDRKIFLFDTFSGFDERDKTERELKESGKLIERTGGFVNTSEKVALSKLPWKKNVSVKKGYFPDTAIGDLEVENARFALVSLDMDLYKPMKAGLDYFWDKMSPGGFILVDEARCQGMPGARRALIDFCREKKAAYSIMDYRYDRLEFNNAVAVVQKPLE